MTVKEKIELLKLGVKMSDIKELEKEERKEDPQPQPTPPAPEPNPAPEPQPTPQVLEPNPELEELKRQIETLTAEKANLTQQLSQQNAQFQSIKDQPEENYNEVDVFAELFHKKQKKED